MVHISSQIYKRSSSQSFHSLSLFNGMGKWGCKKLNKLSDMAREGIEHRYHCASDILFEWSYINVINVIHILIYAYISIYIIIVSMIFLTIRDQNCRSSKPNEEINKNIFLISKKLLFICQK